MNVSLKRILSIGRRKRVHTPTVLQMEAVECGAASLGIILGYWGRFVPLEELRKACGVSRDGSKASNITKAAREYGLEAKGYKRKVEDLWDIETPFIVFWNFNHFLVVEGRDTSKNLVYLNDPGEGPRTVSSEEFNKAYTGIVLSFSPGSDFAKGGDRPGIIKSLKPRIAGSEKALLFVGLVSVGLVLPGIIVPVFSKIFVDDFLVGRSTEYLNPLLFAMGVAACIQAVLVWLQQHYLLRLETKLALATSSTFLWHVLRLPILFFTQRYAGDISSRVSLGNSVAKLLSRDMATAIFNLVSMFFFACLMFLYDWVLTSIGILFASMNVFALMLLRRKRADSSKKMQQEEGKVIGVAMSGLQMIETLKASGAESDFFARWAGHQAKVTNARQALGATINAFSVLPTTLTMLNTAAILGFGSLRVMNGELSMGTLVAFQGLMMNFSEPVNRLVQLAGTLQDAEGDMNRLDDVMRYEIDSNTEAEVTDQSAKHFERTAKLSGRITIENLCFGFSPMDPPLIESFSLQLEPGTRVALVGGSGSGKSTISKIIAGVYQPWSGEILFDGYHRKEIPREVITNSLSMVDQDISMFEGSIRENLTMWDHTISEDRLLQAAMDADIHDIISARQGGYDSLVEEGGTNFSGGQRQRLEIARSLVNNPSVLVLDEATSALDPATEKTIDQNLRRRGCTCIIVAHRLSTIRDCDEIIVLRYGKVIERGTHEELMRDEGSYEKLINAAH